MKLVTYADEQKHARSGVLARDGSRIIDLASAADPGEPDLSTLQAVIEGGDAALDAVRRVLRSADANGAAEAGADEAGTSETSGAARPGIPYDGAHLLAPLPRPVQIRDVLCFLDHMRNAGRVAMELAGADPAGYELPSVFTEIPLYYKANRMCVIGPEADIEWPAYANLLDYELELGIVIGRRGRDIPREKARDHVFGYTIFNDVSARDAQVAEMAGGLGPAKGKDFDTGNILGPCIATADELDAGDLTMIARINGHEVSRGSSGQMDHKIEDVIAYVSRGETIHPGEILGSGTVPLGCGLEHKRFLADGDLIELEIEGIGVLRNRIVRAAS